MGHKGDWSRVTNQDSWDFNYSQINWGHMKTLVTGSEGVVAKELIPLLEGELLLIDKKTGNNLNDESTWRKIVDFQPDIVYHLAASFERTKEDHRVAEKVYEDDIMATHNLLLNCMTDSVKTFVFPSSYLVYGKGTYQVSPRNMVGTAKWMNESELDAYKATVNPKLAIIKARIYRVYGKGSLDVISRWCKHKVNEIPVSIYNEENSFDYIHARDVAKGLKHAADSGFEGIFELGTGVSTKVKDVADMIGVEYDLMEPIEDELENTVCNHLAMQYLPEITVEEGIKEILAYEESRLNNVSR